MRGRRKKEAGFTLIELLMVLIIIAVLVGVVVWAVMGTKTGREEVMATDIQTVQNAAAHYTTDTYTRTGHEVWPTIDGNLPEEGYAEIDWLSSYTYEGEILVFYPDYISDLPNHWDEGIWRIDSDGIVSVDIDPSEY